MEHHKRDAAPTTSRPECSRVWVGVNTPDLARQLQSPQLQASGYSPESIVAKCISGDMQLWKCDDCFIVTCITVLPLFKELCIVYVRGSGFVEHFETIIGFFERAAKEQGCKRMVCYCRPGLAKIGKEKGWSQHQTVMVKTSETAQ